MLEKKLNFSKVVELREAPADGVFPDDFYITTNLQTFICHQNRWIEVEDIEMDCGVVLQGGRAFAVPINEVKKGDMVVIGDKGIKTIKAHNQDGVKEDDDFCFMNSTVSSERSKGRVIAELAAEMKKIKDEGGDIVVVGGPAIIHTGAAEYLLKLIQKGFVGSLLAGNALATHDIEVALYGTSLDVQVGEDKLLEGKARGQHIKAINEIRKAGSIGKAVEKGVLNRGIMYELHKNNVDYVLAGSIRDDGPLPDTITDTMKAQEMMREKAQNAHLVLMLATMLHSIATGNMLPAEVKSVCVDINTDTVIQLADRGSAQATGLVTDVEMFLRALVDELTT